MARARNTSSMISWSKRTRVCVPPAAVGDNGTGDKAVAGDIDFDIDALLDVRSRRGALARMVLLPPVLPVAGADADSDGIAQLTPCSLGMAIAAAANADWAEVSDLVVRLRLAPVTAPDLIPLPPLSLLIPLLLLLLLLP